MDRRIVDWHTHVWLPQHLGPLWGPELDAKYHAIAANPLRREIAA